MWYDGQQLKEQIYAIWHISAKCCKVFAENLSVNSGGAVF